MTQIDLAIPSEQFIHKALHWLDNNCDSFTYLNPNQYNQYPQKAFRHLLAFGSTLTVSIDDTRQVFDLLEKTRLAHPLDWLFVFMCYDAKDGVEDLQTGLKQTLPFRSASFIIPEHVWEINSNTIHILKGTGASILQEIQSFTEPEQTERNPFTINQLVSKQHYLDQVSKIQTYIRAGNAYEITYCIPFTGKCVLPVVDTYHSFNKKNPMPFSCFNKFKNEYILSASPERFIKKTGTTIYSQPIKGTSKRGDTIDEDEALKNKLGNSEKEQAENTMIVDLVRNDLSRTGLPGSVKVTELSGVYSFPNVHQLISTIQATKEPSISSIEVIKHAYPMGSMTGAPKVSAMQLIEEVELVARGPYSGTVGYMDPDDNFDFNVLIRTIFYNKESSDVFMEAGSAITTYADAASEYEECVLKITPIIALLSSTN